MADLLICKLLNNKQKYHHKWYKSMLKNTLLDERHLVYDKGDRKM